MSTFLCVVVVDVVVAFGAVAPPVRRCAGSEIFSYILHVSECARVTLRVTLRNRTLGL